jgi:hypothetical protein
MIPGKQASKQAAMMHGLRQLPLVSLLAKVAGSTHLNDSGEQPIFCTRKECDKIPSWNQSTSRGRGVGRKLSSLESHTQILRLMGLLFRKPTRLRSKVELLLNWTTSWDGQTTHGEVGVTVSVMCSWDTTILSYNMEMISSVRIQMRLVQTNLF